MKIVEVHLDGFGRLVNRCFEFANGFNLIFGPNETGKSTLQRAIVALLYGFLSEGRLTSKEGQQDLAAFQPWLKDAPYTGSLIYTLADGQTFRVQRRFEPRPETRLFLHPGTADISAKFKGQSQGRLFFADQHLGMSKEVFENTCHIRQAELVTLSHSASAITDTLVRLSAAASTDTTATQAINLLAEVVKENVGSGRARTKPLPRLQEHLNELEKERRQVLERRREIVTKKIELNQATTRLHTLQQQVAEWHYLEALAASYNWQQQLTSARQATAEVKQATEALVCWELWANFPAQRRDEVLTLTTQRQTLMRECAEAQQHASDAEQQHRSLAEKITAAEGRVTELAGIKEVQTESLTEVRDLAQQWQMARLANKDWQERWQKAQTVLETAEQELTQTTEQLKPLVELGHTGLAQLRQQWLNAQAQLSKAQANLVDPEDEWAKVGMTEAQFIELEQQVQQIQAAIIPPPQPRRGCNLFVARRLNPPTPVIPIEVATYNGLQPIYAKLVEARTEMEAMQAAFTTIETDLHQTLGKFNGRTLDEVAFADLGQKLDQHRQKETEVRQQQKTVAGLQSDLDQAHRNEAITQAALQAKLAALGLDTSDLEVSYNSYAQQCEQKAQLERAEAELERLQLQSQAFDLTIEQWHKKQLALQEIEGQLRQILTEAGIECSPKADEDTLEVALDRFNEGCEKHWRWDEARRAYETATKHQESFSPLVIYEQSLAEVEARLAKMRADRPELALLQADQPAQVYTTSLGQVERELAGAQVELNELQNSMRQLNSNLRYLAEIDEEIGQVKARIHHLEWYRDTAELARTELTQATEEFQKQFAPKLETLMREGLNRITRGRYTEVYVDPKNLAVSMTAPELGQAVSVEQLSTGTRELVYLMLRVSIAQLMSHTGEALPLLLDDPLVQCDRGRQEQALTFLSHLAEETQLFLFTKDEWIKTWFEDNLSQLPAHKLHDLE